MLIQQEVRSDQTAFLPASAPFVSRDDVSSDAVDPEVLEAFRQAQGWSVPSRVPFAGQEAHEFYDYVSASDVPEGELQLEPTITSFYGHEIIAPAGVDILEIRRWRTVRLVIVTLIRVAPGRAAKVLAWQGDNDTLHLLEPLPGEDEVLGVYHAIVFGKRRRDDVVKEESRDHYLRTLEYGDTAILDADVTALDTRFPKAVMQA